PPALQHGDEEEGGDPVAEMRAHLLLVRLLALGMRVEGDPQPVADPVGQTRPRRGSLDRRWNCLIRHVGPPFTAAAMGIALPLRLLPTARRQWVPVNPPAGCGTAPPDRRR